MCKSFESCVHLGHRATVAAPVSTRDARCGSQVRCHHRRAPCNTALRAGMRPIPSTVYKVDISTTTRSHRRPGRRLRRRATPEGHRRHLHLWRPALRRPLCTLLVYHLCTRLRGAKRRRLLRPCRPVAHLCLGCALTRCSLYLRYRAPLLGAVLVVRVPEANETAICTPASAQSPQVPVAARSCMIRLGRDDAAHPSRRRARRSGMSTARVGCASRVVRPARRSGRAARSWVRCT